MKIRQNIDSFLFNLTEDILVAIEHVGTNYEQISRLSGIPLLKLQTGLRKEERVAQLTIRELFRIVDALNQLGEEGFHLEIRVSPSSVVIIQEEDIE